MIGLHWIDVEKSINKLFEKADTHYGIIFVDFKNDNKANLPDMSIDNHPPQIFDKTKWFKVRQQITVCPAIQNNPRALERKDAELLLEMFEQENTIPNRYFFIVTWRYFLHKFGF